MSEPLVFIILVNWNGKAVTLDCLDSLSEISYKNSKVLVVDNASSDGSVPAIRQTHPEAIVLEQTENLRFAGGNNAGIAYALKHGAELVCLLNNDTTVDREFLSRLVLRIESGKNIGMVAPKIFYHNKPNTIWFAGGKISMWTGTMRHIGIREEDHGQHDTSIEIDYATGCCILTHREVIEKVGMLDESFFMYAEDADWSMRVRRSGYSIVYEPGAKVWHQLSVAGGGHLSWFKMKNKFISNYRFFHRYATLLQMMVYPWLNIVVNSWAGMKYLFTAKRG